VSDLIVRARELKGLKVKSTVSEDFHTNWSPIQGSPSPNHFKRYHQLRYQLVLPPTSNQ